MTIRKFHPWNMKKYVHPFFEVPFEKLLQVQSKRSLGLQKLLININTKNKKSFKIDIFLIGFKLSQKDKIIKSLKNAIK